MEKFSYIDVDNQSVSERISNSITLKSALPESFSTKPPSPVKKMNPAHLPIENLINSIDKMDQSFEEMSEMEIHPNDLKFFEADIKDWIEIRNNQKEIDKKLEEFNDALKEKRRLEKQCKLKTQRITDFMEKYNIEDVNAGNKQKIVCRKTEKPVGASKKKIRESINNFFIQQPDIAKELLNFIDSLKEIKIVKDLETIEEQHGLI